MLNEGETRLELKKQLLNQTLDQYGRAPLTDEEMMPLIARDTYKRLGLKLVFLALAVLAPAGAGALAGLVLGVSPWKAAIVMVLVRFIQTLRLDLQEEMISRDMTMDLLESAVKASRVKRGTSSEGVN